MARSSVHTLPRRSHSQSQWRRVIGMAVASGVPVPGFTASLSYFDTYRRDRLPANLVQVRGRRREGEGLSPLRLLHRLSCGCCTVHPVAVALISQSKAVHAPGLLCLPSIRRPTAQVTLPLPSSPLPSVGLNHPHCSSPTPFVATLRPNATSSGPTLTRGQTRMAGSTRYGRQMKSGRIR